MLVVPFVPAGVVLDKMSTFTAEGTIALPAVSATWSTVATLTVDTVANAYVTGYGVAVNDSAYDYTSGGILFRLVRQAGAVPGLGSFRLQHGTPSVLAPLMLLCFPGDQVQVQCQVAGAVGAATRVAARLLGYQWPQAVERPRAPARPARER